MPFLLLAIVGMALGQKYQMVLLREELDIIKDVAHDLQNMKIAEKYKINLNTLSIVNNVNNQLAKGFVMRSI